MIQSITWQVSCTGRQAPSLEKDGALYRLTKRIVRSARQCLTRNQTERLSCEGRNLLLNNPDESSNCNGYGVKSILRRFKVT